MRLSASLVALSALVAGCADQGVYPQECAELLPGWVSNEHGFGILGMATDFRLRRDGQALANRKPITRNELAKYSDQVGQLNPPMFVTFVIDDGTPCSDVNAVRKIISEGAKCSGENSRKCGEGPGPWPVFGDVPPFPIVREYKDGKYRWLDNAMTDEEWRARNVRRSPRSAN